jgi:hypothetical protein
MDRVSAGPASPTSTVGTDTEKLAVAVNNFSAKHKIRKLQCHSCGYSRVEDIKRDWYAAELKILGGIHQNIFKDHVIAIVEISDEELRAIISAQREKIAVKRRQNVSAVAECMKELSKLERDSLEALWQEYSA